jgi:hypothetical protein
MEYYKSDHYKNYLTCACEQIQQLASVRMTKMTQEKMSVIAGCSLRTIQRFENYQLTNNAYLLWLYKQLFAEKK